MMKVLTVYHPFSELIALGQKTIETRSWEPKNYRGPIAIHCATSRRPWHMDLAFDEPFYSALDPLHREIEGKKAMRLHLGCILAIANLVDCLPIIAKHATTSGALLDKNGEWIEVTGNEYAFGNYESGRYAWRLEDVHQLAEPIPAKGMQRIWNWDETPHQIIIDPWVVGDNKIWTPRGIMSGRLSTDLDGEDGDYIGGLEVL